MKCPYKDCDYIYGWDSETMTNVSNTEGDFYKLSNNIKAERDSGYDSDERTVYACPKCRRMFIDLY